MPQHLIVCRIYAITRENQELDPTEDWNDYRTHLINEWQKARIIKMKKATTWIEEQDTKQARTLREKAKFLVAVTLPKDVPHALIWWNVLKISKGI